MTTEATLLQVGTIAVAIHRQPIKHLHLGVYPPEGAVRVAAPLAVTDAAIRVAVLTHLTWIRRQQENFGRQSRQSQRELVSGESHFFLGQRYRMTVIRSATGKTGVAVVGKRTLELRCRPGASVEARQGLLDRWYREELRGVVAPMIEKWEERLGVRVAAWGIKRMKTLWGACNAATARVWLNAELAKKGKSCIEYVVVHELAHLLSRTHDERFQALLNTHLPKWKQFRAALNAAPLPQEEWISPFDRMARIAG